MKIGNLYIVATPIGNLKDITFRAIETLKQVDLIVCEDTRQTRKLLNHYKIKKPVLSYHQHSNEKKLQRLIDKMKKGENIAYVSDAGMCGDFDSVLGMDKEEPISRFLTKINSRRLQPFRTISRSPC